MRVTEQREIDEIADKYNVKVSFVEDVATLMGRQHLDENVAELIGEDRNEQVQWENYDF